jgi:hypothetical protein
MPIASKPPPDTGAIDSDWGDDAPAPSLAQAKLRQPEIPRSPGVPRELRGVGDPPKSASDDGSGVREQPTASRPAGQREALKQGLARHPPAKARSGSGTYAAVRADELPAPAKRPSRTASGTRPSVRAPAAAVEAKRQPARKASGTSAAVRPSADVSPQPKQLSRAGGGSRASVGVAKDKSKTAARSPSVVPTAVRAPAASVTEAPKALSRPPPPSVRPPPPSAVAARLDANLPANPEADVPFVSSDLIEDDEPTNPAVKLAQLLSSPASTSPAPQPRAPQPSLVAVEATRTPVPTAPKDLPKAILPELPPAFPAGDIPPTLRNGAPLPPELRGEHKEDDPELSFTEAPGELLASDAPSAVSLPPPRGAAPSRQSWFRKPALGWAVAATVALALGTAAGTMLHPKSHAPTVAEVAAAPPADPAPNKPLEAPQRARLPGELPPGQAPRPGSEPAEPEVPAAAPVETKSIEIRVTPVSAQIVAGADRLGEGAVTVRLAAGEKKVLAAMLAGYKTRKVVIDGSKALVKLELTPETPIAAAAPKAPPAAPAAPKAQLDLPAIPAAAPTAPTKSFESDTSTPAPKTQSTPAPPAKQPARGNRPWEPENFSDEPGH